jgi:hypothetical protein
MLTRLPDILFMELKVPANVFFNKDVVPRAKPNPA